MVKTIGLGIPNVLKNTGVDFLAPAGRLIWSSLLLIVSSGVIFWLCKRPKPAQPATWAQAMLGATVSFGLMLLAYGVVPHEWLIFANGYLKWDTTHFLIQGREVGESYLISDGHWFLPINVPYAALKDVIASGLYIVFLGVNMRMFVLWQKRPAAPTPEGDEGTEVNVGTSAYGKTMTAKV